MSKPRGRGTVYTRAFKHEVAGYARMMGVGDAMRRYDVSYDSVRAWIAEGFGDARPMYEPSGDCSQEGCYRRRYLDGLCKYHRDVALHRGEITA